MQMSEGILNTEQIQISDFGPLVPFLSQDTITDINWNGKALWIDDTQYGRQTSDIILDSHFVDRFATKMSNVVSKQFNKYNPVLEAETKDLRISVIHHEVNNTGTAISIRKIPVVKRLETKQMIDDGYCSEQVSELLRALIKGKMNVVISGLPGVGKTELIKYEAGFTKKTDRIITIEDSLEMHLPKLYPDKDILEFKVNPKFTYTDAIKAALRQLPTWLIIAEIRQKEVQYFMEGLSCGTHGITSVHAESVDKIPARIRNMADRPELYNDTYRFIDAGIHIRKTTNPDGSTRRYVEQMCFFERNEAEDENIMTMIVDGGKVINSEIPESKLKKFDLHHVRVPGLRKE